MSNINAQLRNLLEDFTAEVKSVAGYSAQKAEQALIAASNIADGLLGDAHAMSSVGFFFEQAADVTDAKGNYTPMRDEALEMATVYKSELTA